MSMWGVSPPLAPALPWRYGFRISFWVGYRGDFLGGNAWRLNISTNVNQTAFRSVCMLLWALWEGYDRPNRPLRIFHRWRTWWLFTYRYISVQVFILLKKGGGVDLLDVDQEFDAWRGLLWCIYFTIINLYNGVQLKKKPTIRDYRLCTNLIMLNSTGRHSCVWSWVTKRRWNSQRKWSWSFREFSSTNCPVICRKSENREVCFKLIETTAKTGYVL